jgi:hypothetical protein
MKEHLARSSSVRQSSGRARWSIFSEFEDLDLNHMKDLEERITGHSVKL